MELHPFLAALIGGLCIGIAASLMMLTIGRVTGITGISFNTVSAPIQNTWSVMFVVGLVGGAALYHFVSGSPVPGLDLPLPLLIAGGITVGFGTKLGRGCTSGHGICGLAFFSNRSIVATSIFMLSAAITVFVTHHLGLS
ncbi:MAG: YeeE/YedE family protein [Gammaproteobacteria bacterium]|jgi:uncharacterized protein|nr:YeeE/YedE family protein [Gammaproteobacteria bacterium]MBT4493081.1 YeeE/YedE family protein [Gammaproteobacteria bacterium]MBT7369215.1 YeeE/YedE family protein [Gammaproteobacteria bacterium]